MPGGKNRCAHGPGRTCAGHIDKRPAVDYPVHELNRSPRVSGWSADEDSSALQDLEPGLMSVDLFFERPLDQCRSAPEDVDPIACALAGAAGAHHLQARGPQQLSLAHTITKTVASSKSSVRLSPGRTSAARAAMNDNVVCHRCSFSVPKAALDVLQDNKGVRENPYISATKGVFSYISWSGHLLQSLRVCT